MSTRLTSSMRRGAVVAAALCVSVSGGLAQAVPVSPADAAAVIQTFRNQGSGLCMDDTNVAFRTYRCNGTNPQKWRVRTLWPNTRELRNVNTGRCIEDGRDNLRTWRCDESGYQKWYIDHWNDGTIRFRNRATGRCIVDDPLFGLEIATCNASRNQSWY